MCEPLPVVIDTKEELDSMVVTLEKSRKLKRGKANRTNLTTTSSQPIVSWKFNEWDYGKSSVTLPCYARGLFINPENNRIMVRGYDKFFNVNEVDVTKLSQLEKLKNQTFNLTLKENGCIIFISGDENDNLIVCSKHSTGTRDDLERNHAVQGEKELVEQLKIKGKSSKDLARYLYSNNLTAVCELCDDDFEEHVLEYSKENSGLYLHGLNYNTIEFKTYPMNKVDEFSDKWGFKKIENFDIVGFEKLWAFLEDCSKTGTYNGKEIEGFVVRTKNNEDKDFFFKYKFEEPYLLYRQFREVTKMYIKNSDRSSLRIKKHPFITNKYVDFIENLFYEQPELKEEYTKGFGIIKVRKLFLKSLGLNELNGIELIKISDDQEKLVLDLSNLSLTDKYVLIPISTVGCGKTTTFQTLVNLFPTWGHVQNDNIANGKKGKHELVNSTLKALAKNDCKLVFCDRNNHQFIERKQILEDLAGFKSKFVPSHINLKFVVVNFIPEDYGTDNLFDLTFDRIVKRGDNHQSIKSGSDQGLAKLIVKGFIQRLQPLDTSHEPDSNFDHVINLKISENSSLENAKTIYEQLKKIDLSLFESEKQPNGDDFDNAFQTALRYQPSFTKTFSTTTKKKKVSYYGIAVNHDQLIGILKEAVGDNSTWKKLEESNQIQDSFHVTLAHLASLQNNEKFKLNWAALGELFHQSKVKDKNGKQLFNHFCDLTLKRVVISKDRLITVEVELQQPDLPYNNKHLHVTIGTLNGIKPFESNVTLEKVYNGSLEDIEIVGLVNKKLLQQQCFAFY